MTADAKPPGLPDEADLSKLVGWQPSDPVALAAKQRVIAGAYRAAFLVWSGAVLFTLLTMIFTGSLFFMALGYAVTIPYLLTGYKYRQRIDAAAELQAWCDLDGC